MSATEADLKRRPQAQAQQAIPGDCTELHPLTHKAAGLVHHAGNLSSAKAQRDCQHPRRAHVACLLCPAERRASSLLQVTARSTCGTATLSEMCAALELDDLKCRNRYTASAEW